MNPLTSLKILDNRLKLLALLAPKTNFEKNRFFGYAIENGQRAPNVNRLTSIEDGLKKRRGFFYLALIA